MSDEQNLSSVSGICPVCHQPILPQYYFCPNCGAKINEAPLSTTMQTQSWIYAFSIILPWLCFLFINKWPGMKYYHSEDTNTKRIGQVALALIIISSILTVYLAYVWTEDAIQSSISSINTDFGE